MTVPPKKTRKPAWVIDKERARRASAAETVWLFGLHAVRDALANPARSRLRLVVTKNAADRLGDAIAASGMEPEIVDARVFDREVPLAPSPSTRAPRSRSGRWTGAGWPTSPPPEQTPEQTGGPRARGR